MTAHVDLNELQRLRAMEQYIGGIFDDWVGSISQLMALYEPGLDWGEVLPMVHLEVSQARRLVAQLAPETSDPCIGHYGTHGDHENQEWLDGPEDCPLHDLLNLLGDKR